jgi:hypothetical protein
MQNRTTLTGLLTTCLAAAVAAPAVAQQAEPQQTEVPPTAGQPNAAQLYAAQPRVAEQTLDATAKVTAVDKANRTVTLKNEQGESQTIPVGPEVERFDEVEVGDTVRATYSIGIASELRPPTEEEAANPFVVIGGEGKAEKSEAPAAGAARMVRIVATVQSLDRTNNTVTLEGPNGNQVTVQVDDPALLGQARVGSSVVVTAAESVALSLEKVGAKKTK